MTAGKTLLFLSAADFHARTWQDGALSAATHFTDDAEGREHFAAFLRMHRAPAMLLADLVEEDFRHEIVPHLRGGDRSALIRRKLEQYYRNTPFRRAVTLQRRMDGRRDDDMLFSALTNPALLSPWLDIVLAQGIALTGIYSVPGISAPLVKDVPSGGVLLLSWERHAGVRQSYFDGGKLRFSRLTPLSGENSFGATAAAEVARTQQYLNNLNLLPPGSALDVLAVCHASDRDELQTQLEDSPYAHYRYLDIQELGQLAGSKRLYTDSDATPLFLHLLASRPSRNHYAAAEHTRFLRLSYMRRTLLGMGALAASAGLLLACSHILQGMQFERESKTIRMQTGKLAQQARQITASFPANPAPSPDMKAAALLARDLDKHPGAPRTILDGLSHALDDFPEIRINKLSWQTDTAIDEAPIILLDGELEEFGGDYRSTLEYLARFRQALEQRGYETTAQSLPLDTSPQGSISTGAGDSDGKPIMFSLKLSRKAAA